MPNANDLGAAAAAIGRPGAAAGANLAGDDVWTQAPRKRADGRADGRTGGRADGRTGGRADGRTGGRTGGRADGRTGGRADGRTGGRADRV
jgi:hypothetical protein